MNRSLLLVLSLFLLIVGCEQNEQGQPPPQENPLAASAVISPSDDPASDSAGPVMSDRPSSKDESTVEVVQPFLAHFKRIVAFRGQILAGHFESKPRDELLQIIHHPISYEFDDYTGNGALLYKNQSKIILQYYSLRDMQDLHQDAPSKDIYYYELPSILSENLKIIRVEQTSSFIWDIDNRLLMMISHDDSPIKDEGQPPAPLLINSVVQFGENVDLGKITTLCGYLEGNSLNLVITDRQNSVYLLDVDSLETNSLQNMGAWRTVSAYVSQGNAPKKVFLYQYNEKENKLRKWDFSAKQEVMSLNLAASPIQGEVMNVATDQDDLIYVLTRDQSRSHVFLTNEKTFGFYDEMSTSGDERPFGGTTHLWYHMLNAREFYLVLFDPSATYPVDAVIANGDVWKSAKQ